MATNHDSQTDAIVFDLESERIRRSSNGGARPDPAGQPFLADPTRGEDPCLLEADPAYANTEKAAYRAYVADYPVQAGALEGCIHRCPYGSCFKRKLNISCK